MFDSSTEPQTFYKGSNIVRKAAVRQLRKAIEENPSILKPKRAYNLPQQGNRVAHKTAAKAETQGPLIKDFRVDDAKFKSQATKSSALQHSDNAENSEKA